MTYSFVPLDFESSTNFTIQNLTFRSNKENNSDVSFFEFSQIQYLNLKDILIAVNNGKGIILLKNNFYVFLRRNDKHIPMFARFMGKYQLCI